MFRQIQNEIRSETKRKRKRGRPKFTLERHGVAEMLELYSAGMPITVICEEYKICYRALRRLIDEYEFQHGWDSLRKKRVMRYE